MQIVLSKEAGFCFGVERAIDIALKVASDQSIPVYTLGPIIHNKQVVERLEESGIKQVESLENEKDGILVIRSHGLSPNAIQDAKNKGFKICDATCPFVKKAQHYAEKLTKEGYTVIIVGDKGHPEVTGLLGYADEKAMVIDNVDTLNEKLQKSNMRKFGVITQTTQSLECLQKVIITLLSKTREIRVYNTICTATIDRQFAALSIAKEVDVMVVIGGYNSANTTRLAEQCYQTGTRTYHVETADELKEEWFKNLNKVGVTAGASTPNWTIEEVIARMREMSEEELEQKNSDEQEDLKVESNGEKAELESVERVEEGVEKDVEDEVFEEQLQLEEEIIQLHPGDIVKGTIKDIGEVVLVDIGYKSEVVIPKDEIVQEQLSDCKEGDEITVYVESIGDGEENDVIVSKKKADIEISWRKLQKAFEEETQVEAEVTERVKGGLLVDVGVRGFVPASQVSREYIEDLEQFIGKTLVFKIIEIDRRRNNVVLSRKALLELEHENAKNDIFNTIEKEEIRKGVVKRITDFGAFVDIGSGVEGLLHISEMAWSRIEHPSQILKEKDEIDVMVLEIDKERERISLGLKQTKQDPWLTVEQRYVEGNTVKGIVTKTVDFGAFVKLEDGVEGLIHISELANRRVETAEEVVSIDEEVEVKVINVNPKARKIGLSLRAIEEERAASSIDDLLKDNNSDEDTDGITIGERLGDLFSNNK